jgi:NAD(P)H-flavin reductase
MTISWVPHEDDAAQNLYEGTAQVLWLDIVLPLDRTIRPGQYVQLWMPRAGFRAFVQLALFYVVICDWEGGRSRRPLRLVARPQPGPTRKLYRDALASPRSLPVTVLGPYGRPHNLSRFGTIIFVVEDIGIFCALSYIEMLVEASHKREAIVRKLEILWQHDKDFGQSNPHFGTSDPSPESS